MTVRGQRLARPNPVSSDHSSDFRVLREKLGLPANADRRAAFHEGRSVHSFWRRAQLMLMRV
jgi:hypothetical protein